MTETVAETERLILRTWDHDDRAAYVRHCNTPEVTRFLGGLQSDEDMAAAFERIDGYQRETGHTFWVVERKSDGAFLGFCGLKLANDPGTPIEGDVEIGWRLRSDVWGQGFAREAAETSLKWAWDNLDV